MRVFDASSLVHAWDNYPIGNFPRFWEWLELELAAGRMLISRVAFEEVDHVCPDCSDWLNESGAARVEIDNAIATQAQSIKGILGIANDEYGTGVDENDIVIISTAKCGAHSLITNEARQPALPANTKKYKIPAVCALAAVNVLCENMAETIKQSNRVF